MSYRNAASIIAKNSEGKILIVKKPREQNAWQFPQGGLENNETVIEGAMREFEEELGNNNITILGTHNTTYSYDFPEGYLRFKDSGEEFKGQHIHFCFANYTGTDADIHLQVEELENYAWITESEISSYFEKEAYIEACKNALASFPK